MTVTDSGMAHARGDEQRVLYRVDTAAGCATAQSDVAVWPATGGVGTHMPLTAFNARYIVDYRFDLRRLP